jgi:hypothetical protein
VDNVRRLAEFVHEYSALHRPIAADLYLAETDAPAFEAVP